MPVNRVCLFLGAFFLSFAAPLTAAPTINSLTGSPSNTSGTLTMIMGSTATLTVTATASSGSLSYQWQGSKDGGTSWGSIDDGGPVSGAMTAILKLNAPAYQLNGAQVRCVVTDGSGSITSDATTLNLTSPAPLLILAHPTVRSAFQGDSGTSFNVLAVPTGTNTISGYQWQHSTDGGATWSNLSNGSVYSGIDTAALTIADPYTNFGGASYSNSSPRKYRCKLTSGSYSINSKAAPLVLFATPTNTAVVTTLVGGNLAASIVANTNSPITVRVSGIPSGGTVLISRFADLNGNSAIDDGEPLVQSFMVTDGSKANATFGGVTDPDIPVDADGTADGTVNATFYLAKSAELAQAAGQYVFRVVSATGAFHPVDSSVFTVMPPTLAHTVSGQVGVYDSGGNLVVSVPHAQVALLGGGGDYLVSATIADGNGNFTLPADSGSYVALALAPGYVADMATAATPDTTSGNVTGLKVGLSPADYMQVLQLNDQNGGGALRGVQIFYEAKNENYVALANTDFDGVATAGALAAGDWTFDVSSQSLNTMGYVRPSSDNGANMLDTTNGGIGLQAANALIYGTLTGSDTSPLANVYLNTGDQNKVYSVDTTTDASGQYYLPVYGNGGQWNVNVDSNSPVFASTYSAPQGQQVSNVSPNNNYPVNFVAPAVTAHLSGTVTNAGSGLTVSGVQIDLLLTTSTPNGPMTNFVSSVTTSAGGGFSFGVSAGNWQIMVDRDSANANGIVGPALSYTVPPTGATDVTGIAYVVEAQTGTISGMVTDNNSQGVANANIYAYATINGKTYNAGANTDTSGHYTFAVIAGDWTVGVNTSNGITYSNQTVTVPVQNPPGTQTSTTVNFAPPVAASHLQGHVLDGSNPVGGVMIGANLQNGNGFAQTTTDGSGYFDLGVSTGTWNLYLINNSSYLTPSHSETVTDPQTISNIQIPVVMKTGTLEGYVYQDQGTTPAVGVNVFAYANINSVGYNQGTQTDGSGHYSFPVIDGQWTIGVNGVSQIYTNQTVTVTGSATQNFTPLQFNSHFTGTVSNNGTPVQGVVVGGYLQNMNLSVQATTDSNGHFDLAVINSGAGSWYIYIQNGTAMNLVGETFSNQSIGDSQTIDLGTLHVLSVTGTLSGQTKDFLGAGVPGSNVYGNLTVDTVSYATSSSQTDGSGSYSMPVVDGTWTVGVNSNSGLMFPQTTVSVSGATTTQDITATVFNGIPNDTSVNAGDSANFYVNTNAPSTPTLQWEYSTDGSAWNDVPNAAPYNGTTGNNLGIYPTTLGLNGYQYRMAATFTYNSQPVTEYSTAATLTVNGSAPSFSVNPPDQNVYAGNGAAFSVSVGGNPTPTLQWQVLTSGGGSWSNLSDGTYYSGSTTNMLQLANVDSSLNGNQYRCEATNSVQTTDSLAGTLTVNLNAQTVTFNGATVTVNSPVTLSASTTSPLTSFTYAVMGTPTATYTLSGNSLTLTSVGSVTVQASQAGNQYYASASQTATFTANPSFSSWQATYFSQSEIDNTAISGPTVVLTPDGLTNLVKYALGLNPKVAATSGLPVTGTNGTDWTYTFTTQNSATDVVVGVEFSTDLTNWTPLTPGSISSDSTTTTWQATYPMSSAATVFFRVKVTQ